MGKVYLVGAGPGAPDLLTLRAAEILKRAELVFHDALVHPQTLALAARARKILVGKRQRPPFDSPEFHKQAAGGRRPQARHRGTAEGRRPMLFAARRKKSTLCARPESILKSSRE